MENYAVHKAVRDQLDANVKKHSAELQKFPRGENGMTPDHIKASPEYKTAKSNFEKADAQIKHFLKTTKYTTTYKKEIKADRRK